MQRYIYHIQYFEETNKFRSKHIITAFDNQEIQQEVETTT